MTFVVNARESRKLNQPLSRRQFLFEVFDSMRHPRESGDPFDVLVTKVSVTSCWGREFGEFQAIKKPSHIVQRVVTCMDALMSRRHGCLGAIYGSLTFLTPERKKSRDLSDTGFFEWESDGELLSHRNSTLPSPQLRFTSEFEMESGGSTALLPPGKRGCF